MKKYNIFFRDSPVHPIVRDRKKKALTQTKTVKMCAGL